LPAPGAGGIGVEGWSRGAARVLHGSGTMSGRPDSTGAAKTVSAYAGSGVRRFLNDQCLMRASALAYTSLLSIVPLLAVMFAVVKGLGVHNRLEPILLSRFSFSPETTDLVIGYIDRTNVSTLGVLGAATLIVTVISVLGTIEASFNAIWRVAQQRSWWRKLTDYTAVVMLTPFLMLLGVAITSAGHANQIVQWVLDNGYVGPVAVRLVRLSPILMNAVGIGILYAVMPNRNPAWRPIATAAIVAGAAWQVVQWAYVVLQVGVAHNNAIYGALAQLPVTLAWLYVSWTIVLGGAELAALLEFGPYPLPAAGQMPDAQAIALHVLVRAADAFAAGRPPPAVPAEARELRVDPSAVVDVIALLQSLGWVAATDGSRQGVVLARAPETIDLGDLAALAQNGAIPPRCDPRARAAMKEIEQQGQALWHGRTLAEVLSRGAGRREN
jgi:membrane protein